MNAMKMQMLQVKLAIKWYASNHPANEIARNVPDVSVRKLTMLVKMPGSGDLPTPDSGSLRAR